MSTNQTTVPSSSCISVLCGHSISGDNNTSNTNATDAAAKSSSLSARYALIAVNQPCDAFFPALWHHATVRVCCDGGANQVYDTLEEKVRSTELPSVIVGDLDSLRDDVRNYYTKLGVPVIKDDNQDNTDLDKALLWLHKHVTSEKKTELDTVLVYPVFGGRFDQQMNSLNALAENIEHGRFRRLVLLSKGNSIELLGPGRHIIHCHAILEAAKDAYCGLIPLMGPVRTVTSTGLKWNLDASPMRLGGLISTSNRITNGTVTVNTSEPIIWTITPGHVWQQPAQ
jgi:thiamine pyrophosphokinase